MLRAIVGAPPRRCNLCDSNDPLVRVVGFHRKIITGKKQQILAKLPAIIYPISVNNETIYVNSQYYLYEVGHQVWS